MQAEAGKVLTGHWEGKSLLNLLGQQKKYRYEAFEQWFSGHTGPGTEYAPYLIHGTRFMVKRDFFYHR